MRQFSIGATAAVVAAGGYATLYRLGQTRGATDQERQQALVGDELLPNARAWTTHAITVEASAPQVWSWLVQMGWGRAGWYTYRWVDRLLFPANGPSADRILPEHQWLQEGDGLPDGPPEVDCWFTVERLRAESAAGIAVDPAPASVLAPARAIDGVDLELAPSRADLGTDPGRPAEPHAAPSLVVRAGVPSHDHSGGLRHGPQSPARPQAPGRGLRFLGGQEPEDLADRGSITQRGDAGVAFAGVQPQPGPGQVVGRLPASTTPARRVTKA
jgi:hypothetical protein